MTTRQEKLKHARLYVILGAFSAAGRPAEEIAREAVLGGADIIQLRVKDVPAAEYVRTAHRVGRVTRELGALFIVNDDPVVALEAGADGVHVGQDDLSVAQTRRLIGPGLLLGKSTHSTEQALAASREDVDYLGFGPLFGTPTKPDYAAIGPHQISTVVGAFHQPFFAIGGISLENAPRVLALGAERIAVVRAVQDAPDVRAAAEAFKKILTQQETHA